MRVPGSPGPERVRPPQVATEALTRVVPACQAGERAAPTGSHAAQRPWHVLRTSRRKPGCCRGW